MGTQVRLKCQQSINALYVLGTRRIIMVKVWFNRHRSMSLCIRKRDLPVGNEEQGCQNWDWIF